MPMEITDSSNDMYASQVGIEQGIDIMPEEPVDAQLVDMFSLVMNVQTQLLQTMAHAVLLPQTPMLVENTK